MVNKRIISGIFIALISFSSIINPIRYKIFISLLYFFACYEGIAIINKIESKKQKILFFIALNLLLFFFYISMMDLHNIKKELIFFLLLVAWGYDTFAYIIGKKFGKTKISRNISPNKTLEGLVGGMGLNLIFLLIIFKNSYNKFFTFCFFAILLMTFSYLGGNLISFLKRKAKIKDSGFLIPGHGGILDRIDSLLFSSIFLKLFVFLKLYTIFPLKI